MKKLSKKTLNALAVGSQLVSALAVVITVVYLTKQIQDSTTALVNQSHFNALSLGLDPIVMLVNNEDLAAIVERGFQNPDVLSTSERIRFYDHQFLSFNGWEYLYYANESESIPVSLWEGADSYFSELIHTKPGLRKFWDTYEHAFAEPFKSYVESIFQKSRQRYLSSSQRPVNHTRTGMPIQG